MGIQALGAVDQLQYVSQQQFTTVYLGGTNGTVTAKPYPLLFAYDRDMIIDEVAIRAATDGTSTATLSRSPSGTAGDGGTVLTSTLTLSTVGNDTNAVFVFTEDAATVTDPRTVRAGETLFIDFLTASVAPVDVVIYIRWRDGRN